MLIVSFPATHRVQLLRSTVVLLDTSHTRSNIIRGYQPFPLHISIILWHFVQIFVLFVLENMLRTLPRLSRSNPLKAAAVVTTTQPSTSPVGDISSVFPSLSGKAPKPLPPRFTDIKRHIIAGNERAIEQSWTRLLDAIKYRRNEIRKKGSDVR